MHDNYTAFKDGFDKRMDDLSGRVKETEEDIKEINITLAKSGRDFAYLTKSVEKLIDEKEISLKSEKDHQEMYGKLTLKIILRVVTILGSAIAIISFLLMG